MRAVGGGERSKSIIVASGSPQKAAVASARARHLVRMERVRHAPPEESRPAVRAAGDEERGQHEGLSRLARRGQRLQRFHRRRRFAFHWAVWHRKPNVLALPVTEVRRRWERALAGRAQSGRRSSMHR
eukprot:3170163-Pleurochrysis_carterae.AAC.3